MAPIQKVLLRMLFQLELLTLLNLERDFDIVGPREEKRATKRRQEREREREREREKTEKKKNGLATGSLLPAAFWI